MSVAAEEPYRQASDDGSSAIFQERLVAISASARTLPPGADEETQDELGLILQLIPAVERSGNAALLANLELAVESLLAQPPNRLLAIRLREASQQSILRRSPFRSILPGTSASTWVIAGMGILLFLVVPILIVFILFVVPSGGTTIGERGTGTYIAYRFFALIHDSGRAWERDQHSRPREGLLRIRILNPPALFWTGFFKPIIGSTFALFVFCAFASGLLNINGSVNQKFMYLTLAFVAGFSERFAPDLVSRLEGSVIAAERPKGGDEPRPSKEER